MFQRIIFGLVVILATAHSPMAAEQTKSIIYKDITASSYSLAPLMLAGLQQPDFIELPLVLSRDNIPLVFNDLLLHPKTNVVDIFPERSRADGNYYVIDFTLTELEQLSYRDDDEEIQITNHISSLDDTLKILSRLSTGIKSPLQVIAVIKYPWFHGNEVYDISNSVLKTLIAHSGSADTQLYLKCYDPEELQRIKKDLLPGLPVQVNLIQAIDSKDGSETMRLKRGRWMSYNYEWIFTRLGLRVVSGYAYGLALQSVGDISEDRLKSFITDSQALKMKVFIDAEDVSSEEEDAYFDRMLFTLNADGLATDEPARIRNFLDRRSLDKTPIRDTILPEQQKEPLLPPLLSDPERLRERLKNIE